MASATPGGALELASEPIITQAEQITATNLRVGELSHALVKLDASSVESKGSLKKTGVSTLDASTRSALDAAGVPVPDNVTENLIAYMESVRAARDAEIRNRSTEVVSLHEAATRIKVAAQERYDNAVITGAMQIAGGVMALAGTPYSR